MKNPLMIFCGGIILTMMSCENPMSFRTKINEDGSLEKTIMFAKADEKIATSNIFGINERNGWVLKKEMLPTNKDDAHEKRYWMRFTKHFANVSEMNKELNTNSDTSFHVYSSFEKKYRWFYSYIHYSETIKPIQRFKLVSPHDYFNLEDSTFIERLPSEGKAISRADSVYLNMLNEKMSDHFATMGLFKEYFNSMKEVVRKNLPGTNWLDTLEKHKNLIYREIEEKNGNEFKIENIFNKLKIPIPKEKAIKDYAEETKELTSRLGFMTFARDGKYQNEFEMPWTVIHTNADSVNGNRLLWNPLVHKFIYMDYEMFAESRKINWIETIISLIVIIATAFLLTKSSRS